MVAARNRSERLRSPDFSKDATEYWWRLIWLRAGFRSKNLNREGFAAAMIHGGRSQSQRTAALTGFQQGRYRILVATDLASRGIHVQDIAHVINYDLPEIAEN